MANYSYIRRLPSLRKHNGLARELAVMGALIDAVGRALGRAWVTVRAPWNEVGPVFLVVLPGTRVRSRREARRRGLAVGEDVGFQVAIERGPTLAFRHGPNRFECWASGRVQEELADHFGVGVTFDATGETRPPGTRMYRVGATFLEYLASAFPKPLPAADRAHLEKLYRDIVPEGHW